MCRRHQGRLTGVVSTAGLIKNFYALSDRALLEPITIKTRRSDQMVIVSVEEYSRLERRNRRALSAKDVTDEKVDFLAHAEVLVDFAHTGIL